MGAEFSEVGEFLLYVLYIFLAIAIVLFLLILRKKQSNSDFDKHYTKVKQSQYQIDNSLKYAKEKVEKAKKIKTEQAEIKEETTKPIDKTAKVQEVKRELKQQKVIKKIQKKGLPVYRNDMPVIDEVKPNYFEYFKGNKLLIVEDNKINQKILLNVLKNINTPIDVADNGEEAIKKVLEEKNSYDMILMDISMPVMDGINATKNIRQDSRCDNIPIVTVTAFTSGLEIGQMFEAGANAFLTKPLDIHKLFVAMLLYLDNSKSDLPIQKEFDIMGIELDEIMKSMDVEQDAIKETITEFLDKFSSLEYRIPQALDDNDLREARTLLDELDMILDLIGATRMQKFIEDMRASLNSAEDIEYYKVLFIAQYKALLNTYKKYLNSL
jgi:CheY-like chemotaxis protein